MGTTEHVRRSTSEACNEIIDHDIFESINYYHYHRDEIPARIAELEKEWDIERVLELNVAALSLCGILLGATVSKKWLVLNSVVAGLLVQHSVRGWCPPLSLFRKLGIRTQHEIERERFALKTLLGDFDIPKRPKEIWQAIK